MKSQTTKLKKKLIPIFNKRIRLRDNKTCVICGSKTNPNCGHFLSCVANATRFDEINCHCQCAKCNKSHEYNPVPYTNRMREKYGQEMIDELSRLRNTTKKFTVDELEAMITYYTTKIKEWEEK